MRITALATAAALASATELNTGMALIQKSRVQMRHGRNAALAHLPAPPCMGYPRPDPRMGPDGQRNPDAASAMPLAWFLQADGGPAHHKIHTKG